MNNSEKFIKRIKEEMEVSKKHKQGIDNLSKVFTQKQCETIISYHSDWPESEGYIDSKEDRRIDTSNRQCIVYTPPSIEYVPNWFYDKICKTIVEQTSNDYLEEYFNYDSGIQIEVELNLVRYDLGGHFKKHIDIGPGKLESRRKISFTLLLNDSYEGGKLNFLLNKNWVTTLSSETGDMTLFPSYLIHKVEPVTSGIRWALVGWCLGNKPFI